MASTYLTRTTGTPTDSKKYTFAAWIKRCDIGAGNSKIFSRTWGSGGEEKLEFNNDDLIWRNTSGGGGSTNWERVTNRKFRDCSAWYHIVVTFDSTQNTSDDGDRIKIWVNGVQETSFSSSSYPSLNADSAFMDTGVTQNYGRYASGGQETSSIWSHVHLTDGYAYAASDFGSFDNVTGEWKPITSPSVTYGNNGFFWFKDNADTTDNSPNSNTFTVAGGTLTKTEDNPSHNFTVLNVLQYWGVNGATMSNGNTTIATASAGHRYMTSTFGVSKGKYYAEFKCAVAAASGNSVVGVTDHECKDGTDELGQDNYSYAYLGGGNDYVRANGSNVLTGMPTWGVNDIICVALDADNNKLYFRVNSDSWINSADPTSGATGTGAVSITNAQGFYFFGVGDWHGSSSATWQCNFGNGFFGTTAISSEGTNASGIGKFEFDVPTGYTALSTKGLNE